MSDVRDSRPAIRGRVRRKGDNHRGGVSLAGSHEHGAGRGDVDGLQRYTSSGGRVVYRGKGGRIVPNPGKRKHAEHLSEGSHENLVSPRHTSSIHTIHRDRRSNDSPISNVAALVHTSGRHVVHNARGLDCSPISSDNFASGRHVTRGLNEMTDDDAYDDAHDDSENEPEHPSQQNSCDRAMPRDTSGKKFIVRIGQKFADHEIHRKITNILLEHYDKPWATFKMVPKNVIARMFAHFRSLYCWDPDNEQLIYDGFCNVIKGRFRDIMSEWRAKAKEDAREAGHIIGDDEHGFDIICDFPPPFVEPSIWEKLCSGWNTERWLKKSMSGRENRTKEGDGGGRSRHTGGSIGIEERRIKLEKLRGRKVKWIEVFLDTRLKKESKEKYWAGELDINSLVGFEFCTEESKQAFVKYKSEMIKLHGPDLNEHPDDLDVWARVARGSKGRLIGIGSSDAHFAVTGTPSTHSTSALYIGAQRSQEEVQKV